MLALARQIVSREDTDADGESVEQGFAQARDAEVASEEFLVDDGWKAVEAEPEPVVVQVHTNGASGNGRAVEPVVVNPDTLPRDGYGGNGHQDESAEGKQSLFSWAEFLAEEPVQPTGRRGKTKPAAPSLFEWALNAEQDRGKEPVGAGR